MKTLKIKDYWSGEIQTVFKTSNKRNLKKELKKVLKITSLDNREVNKLVEYLKNGYSARTCLSSLLGDDAVEIITAEGFHVKFVILGNRELTHNQSLCYYL